MSCARLPVPVALITLPEPCGRCGPVAAPAFWYEIVVGERI